MNTLISTALSTLLKEGAIAEILVEKAGKKAIAIFQAHFTFSAFEIANSYQKSYAYALAAICAGLATPDQKFRFFQKLTHSKIEREFADQIEQFYFQPFAAQCGVQAEVEQSQLRRQLIDNIKKLSKLPSIFSAEKRDLTEPELAAFIHYKGALAITDVILEQLHTVPDYLVVRDDTVEAFFRFEDLLGNATLFFLHEIFRRDERAKETINILQREGLLLDMRDVKATQEKMLTRLQQQFDEQNASAMQAFEAKNFSKAAQMSSQLESLQNTIKNLPKNLQVAQAAWQKTHQQWVTFAERFHSWGGLLNSQLSQVLAETETLHWEIGAVHDDVKANLVKSEEIADDVKALKQSMADLMARFDLSAQVKLSDELTHHNTTSLKLIQAEITQLKALPHSDPDYNKAEVVKRLESLLTPQAPKKEPEPPVIIVAKKSGLKGLKPWLDGYCETISAAIEKAKAGDRILVKPGVYQEALCIDKPLVIIGDGEVANIVVESKNASCIIMNTDHALVRGLSLHNRAEECYAVNIPQGQLTLEYCDITSDSLSCVGIHGNETEGIVSHCKIHDGKASGVRVYENGTGRIENCKIFGNALAGIAIKTGGNPIVQHCQIHDNKGGIGIWENGTGRIENCKIFGNALSGIEIRTGGNPVIQHCQIHDNQGGVLVYENGTGRIENCDIFGNVRAGIEIKKGYNHVVQKCTIKQNGYWAVLVYEGGSGTIENCDLRNNAKGAWYIESGCPLRRSGNIV